jgi:pheromone shutdown protein TraB
MSQALLKVAKEHSSVVAVVGKGHLSGIKKYWMQPVDVIFLSHTFCSSKDNWTFGWALFLFKYFSIISHNTTISVNILVFLCHAFSWC